MAVVLRVAALLCLLPALLHAGLGVRGELLLDGSLPTALATLATLDSQNRFYGMVFALHAAVLWMAAADLARYAPLLRAQLLIFALGGLARLLSVAQLGWPSAPVCALLAVEIAAPLLLWPWLRHQLQAMKR